MDKIQLLYVENVISRKKRVARQELTFFLLVENVGYDKQVDIVWAGEDEVWHTLPAHYHGTPGQGMEYWSARMAFRLTAQRSLPGNIRFGLRYRTQGQEFWDNNDGWNYTSQADSGIQLAADTPLLNIDYKARLQERQKSVPITVAVDRAIQAEKVTVHWTTDNWQHVHKTPCRTKINYWDEKSNSNARNPNHYGAQVWKGRLRVANAFRVEYSICCESQGRQFWDNNFGNNYSASHEPLKIMILNLHCYQEDNQDYKFSQIARAISDLDVDIVCLQEVAELWNEGHGDWNSNSARIINDRLAKPFYIYTDWSHLGFDKYREGVAILSRFPMAHPESRYVSNSHDVFSIHSRKVVMAQVRVPFIGLINVFSAHLSWWEDGFKEQFERLCEWAANRNSRYVKGTLLCGDFNITAGTTGYHQVVNANEYDDQYLAANEQGLFEKIFKVNDPHWRHLLADDYRIDYIFMNKTSDLFVTSARVLFTDQDYGRVSDHCGYLMTFEPK
ncbi:MAG: endonuclease/exonuclease/phosphatase family protein [Gammaproteobacteria bacterium]